MSSNEQKAAKLFGSRKFGAKTDIETICVQWKVDFLGMIEYLNVKFH